MEGPPAPQFPNLNDLRQEAIRRLGQLPSARQPGGDQADSQRLLHELQVHQVELEMQNEELRAAQFEREASRDRYARYYDLAPVAYFNLDAQGMIVRCNLAACRLLGYERRYLQGRGLLPLVHKDDQPAYFGFFNGLAAGAGPCRVRLRGKTGTTGPVRLEGNRLEDESGRPEYLVAAIPADPAAESTASERLLQEAEAVGGTGSYELDLATRQFRFSDNLYRLLGQEPQSFTPTLDWLNSVSHPEDVDRIGQVLGQAIENREPYYYQRRVYRPDGELCYLASHGKVVSDAEGRAVRLLGTVQNITGQVRTDQFLDTLNEVCFELDGNFTICYANRRACQLWEKTPEQVTGRKVWEVYAGYWSTDLSDALMKTFREAQPVQAEIWLPATQQWLLLHANPSPAGLTVLHFDITTGKGSGEVRRESTIPGERNDNPGGTNCPGGKSAEEQLRKHFTILQQLGLEMQRTLDGVDHCYLVSAVRFGDGLVIISQEVTESKRMTAENLALKLSQQQALLNAILDAQEEERRRISESLHNGVGQVLYATKLHLERVDLSVLPGNEAQVSEALETTGKLLAEAIRETRRVSHELVPVLLHDFGLETALNDFCKRFANLALRLTCRVTGLGDRLDPHLEVALYRISQELILNVVKHAGADQAGLLLERKAGELVLEISDNGRGFGGDQAVTKGRGLRTIRDRVKLLGGTLDIMR